MLLHLRVDHLKKHRLRQALEALLVALHAVEDMGLQRGEELGDLSAAESVQLLRHVVKRGLVDNLVARQLPGLRLRAVRARGTGAMGRVVRLLHHRLLAILGRLGLDRRPLPLDVQRPRDVLVEVELYHALASVQVREAELDALVEAIEHCAVEVSGAVRRDDHHELRRGRAGVVQDRGQRIAQLLAHVPALARGQEGVRLINEEQDAPAAPMDPREELVQLGDRLLLQRSDITSTHDRVLQARVLREALRDHRLPRPWRSIEHRVLQRHAALLRRAGRVGEAHYLRVQVRVEHDVVELRAVRLLQAQESEYRGGGLLQHAPAIRRADERWPPQALIQLLAEQYRHLAREVDASEASHHGTNGEQQVCRRGVDCEDPSRCDLRRRLDRCQRLCTLLLHLRLHGAQVHVLIVPGGADLRLLLHLRLLDRLLDAHLRAPFVGRQPHLQQLLLARLFRFLLPDVGGLLLLQQLQVGRLLLRQLMGHARLVQLRAVVLRLPLLLPAEPDGLLLLLPPQPLDASLHKRDLEIGLGRLPLLYEVGACLALHSGSEVVLERLDRDVLGDRAVPDVVEAAQQRGMVLDLLRPEARYIRLESHEAFLGLRVGELEDLDLCNRAHDLIDHLLSLLPVVVLLLHHRHHVPVKLVDSEVPVIGFRG
mmetsp:Transcript_114803/g.331783  ORF Transcript_114803/g.331783 Transcript_114803/m.331783 type:complete len:654 (+) Transcript_114803:252-2213(+)